MQQTQKAQSFPSFIYKQAKVDETLKKGQMEQWDHAIFILNVVMFAVTLAILIKISNKYHSHMPWLCLEISPADSCLLLPVIQLLLCPVQCHIQVPATISNLRICGSWISSSLHVCWPDFIVTKQLTGHTRLVPDTFALSLFNAQNLRRHNGFLKQIDLTQTLDFTS